MSNKDQKEYQRLAILELRTLQTGTVRYQDSHTSHLEADQILKLFLINAGFKDLAEAYCELDEVVEFWYS